MYAHFYSDFQFEAIIFLASKIADEPVGSVFDTIAEGHMPYLIKAIIPLSKLNLECIGGSEEYILMFLIESMISRLINDSPVQHIIFLKEGEFISPDEIIEINNILPSEQ